MGEPALSRLTKRCGRPGRVTDLLPAVFCDMGPETDRFERGRPPLDIAVVLAENSSAHKSRGLPNIPTVESTNLRQLDDLAQLWILHGSRFRRVACQREMAARAMVVIEVAAHYAAEMSLAENDHMLQAFSR